MSRKIDLVDRKILLQLDTDARKSFSAIGKALGIGKNNVQYRINRLIEFGVIKKFVTQFSLGKMGLFLGKFYIQLSGMDNKIEEGMYGFLQKDKRISWVAKCEGRWDLMVGSYVKNLQQLNKVKNDFLKEYGKYVSSYDVVFLVEGYTSQRTYLLKKKSISKKIEKFIGEEEVLLTDDEKRILKLISNDGRFNYLNLAEKTGLNVKTVRKRIKELEQKGIIQGYVTFVDPQKIGFNFFKLHISLQNYESKLSRFVQYCLELPNVVHVIESLGPWEIELELETENLQSFYDLTHDIRNKFAVIVKKTEYVIITDEKKLDFFPEWY